LFCCITTPVILPGSAASVFLPESGNFTDVLWPVLGYTVRAVSPNLSQNPHFTSFTSIVIKSTETQEYRETVIEVHDSPQHSYLQLFKYLDKVKVPDKQKYKDTHIYYIDVLD